jgi:type II secretory pathway component PulF
MEYKYKAMKTSGEVIEGMIMGNSIEEVAQMIRSNQSYPISIDPYKKAGSKEITFDRPIFFL